MEVQFTEKVFIESFVKDLMDKAAYFNEPDFSLKYIDDEIKPMLYIVEFLYLHSFISEKGYYQCKIVLEETIHKGKKVLVAKNEKEVLEYNKKAQEKLAKQEKYIQDFVSNHKIGDKVGIKGTLIGTNLPRYLEGGVLTVVGFTKRGNVKCRWDEGTTFRISPCLLKDISE